MSDLIVFCGLPGSGKSFIAREYARGTEFANSLDKCITISTDEIRKEITGDESNQSNNALVFETAFERIKLHLQNNEYRFVVFDATNINYKRRTDIVNRFKKYAENIECYFVYADYEECLKRNRERDRKVPDEVIKRMYYNFYVPQLFEGFNSIRIIYNDVRRHTVDELEEILDIYQENPNHRLGLLEHSKKAHDYLANKIIHPNINLCFAAYLHDIGKIKTKTFINTKGEKTDIAHYYSHEKVGAYDSIAYAEKNADDALYIAKLIQWHMLLHQNLSEKTREKYKNKLGEQFWKDLELLHEADLYAH